MEYSTTLCYAVTYYYRFQIQTEKYTVTFYNFILAHLGSVLVLALCYCAINFCLVLAFVIMGYLLWYYRLIALGNRNKLAWFILHATTIHLTTLRTSVRESLQMHFKLVAVRSFHAFIQAGNSLTDVIRVMHYQHAGCIYVSLVVLCNYSL